jgi:gliding motility-associated-like protein
MRPIFFSLLLIVICITFAPQAYGQTCNGSLGDPVINEDFGAGPNPGPPLSGQQTNMNYVTVCPNDGMYTIANSSGNCFNDAWHFLTQDHTGNPNGFMMIVNASYQPSIFFTQQTAVGALCPNTTYFFSAYITNLDLPATCQGQSILPNITFSIETTDGTILKTYNTGDIPTTDNVVWLQKGTFFTSPANSTQAIVVKMSNNAPGGCGNDFALDDITFRACGPMIQAGFGLPGGQSNEELCQGGNANYALAANVINGNNPVYQWQINTNNAGWTDLPGENTNALNIAFNNAITGIYKYRLGIGNGSNITSAQCRVYSQPLTVTVNALPVVPAIPDQTICEGDPIQLTASGGATYTWTGPNIAPTSQNPLVINKSTLADGGNYQVVAVSAAGCAAPPVHATITVLPTIVPGISADATICAGESAQLSSSGGTTYKWTPSTGLDHDDIPTPLATPLQTTTYKVHISNGACIDSSKTVTITVNQNPVADAGSEIFLFEGQSATLNGTVKGDNITLHLWSPATFLSDPTSLNPITTPTDNITYTLTATSLTCGSSTSKVFVRVYKKITIPNTFSPNNDGVNDLWNIEALVTYPESSTFIYNRYGQQVYQSSGYAKPWDGTSNGSPLPAGTYYYIIDLRNKTPKLSGWVLLVR